MTLTVIASVNGREQVACPYTVDTAYEALRDFRERGEGTLRYLMDNREFRSITIPELKRLTDQQLFAEALHVICVDVFTSRPFTA